MTEPRLHFFLRRDHEIKIPSLRRGRRHRRGSPPPPAGTIEEIFDCSRPCPQHRIRAAALPSGHNQADLGGCGCGDGGSCGSCEGSCGGSWGDSGSYSAGNFNAGDIGAWAGTAYDASTAGTGMGGGGDWGSFAATNYSGFDAPNPVFTDVAGPNPGVTTGGGDWGSAGQYSAAGTGGGPGGTFSAASGLGNAFGGGSYYGGSDPGGYYGGGFGGGGGFSGGSRGSDIAGWTSPSGNVLGGSNFVSNVSGPDMADSAGSGGRGDAGGRGGGPAAYSEGGGRGGGYAEGEGEGEGAGAGEAVGGTRADTEGSEDTPSGMDLAADQPSASQTTFAAGGDPEGSLAAAAGSSGRGEVSAPDDGGGGGRGSSFGPQSLDAAIVDAGTRAAETTDYAAASQYVSQAPPAEFQGPGFGTFEGQQFAPSYAPSYAPDTAPTGMDLAGDLSSGGTPGWAISSALANALDQMSQTTQQASQPYDPGYDAPAFTLGDVRDAVYGPSWAQVIGDISPFTNPSWANNPPPTQALQNLSSWWSNLGLNPQSWAYPGPPLTSPRSSLERDALGRGILSVYDFLANNAANLNPNDYGRQTSLNEYITETQAPPPVQTDIPEQIAGPGLQTFDPSGFVEFGDAGPAAAAVQFAPEGVMADYGENYGPGPAYQGVADFISHATPSEFAPGQPSMTDFEGAPGGGFYGPGHLAGGQFADVMDASNAPAAAAADAAQQSGAPPEAADAAASAAAEAAARGDSPADQAAAAVAAAVSKGASQEEANAIGNAVYDAASRSETPAAEPGETVPTTEPGGRTAPEIQGRDPNVSILPSLIEYLNSPSVLSLFSNVNPMSMVPAVVQRAMELNPTGVPEASVYGPGGRSETPSYVTQPGQVNIATPGTIQSLFGTRDQPQEAPVSPATARTEPVGQPPPTGWTSPGVPPATVPVGTFPPAVAPGTAGAPPSYTPAGQDLSAHYPGMPAAVPPTEPQVANIPPATPPVVPPVPPVPPFVPAGPFRGTARREDDQPQPGGREGRQGAYTGPPWQGATTGDRYLSDVYNRTPQKIDSTGNFTWKDPAAAQRFGMETTQYAIGGLDRDFKTVLEALGKAMDRAGVDWSISAAYRDNYRQSMITSGVRASETGSWHGGSGRVPTEPSRRGGIEGTKGAGETYGLGRAVDVTGANRANNQAVWNYIDQHGAKFGIDRVMGAKDPPHIQPVGDFRDLAAKIRQGFDPMTGKYNTPDGKPDPNYARNQELQDREQREAEGAAPARAAEPPATQPTQGQRSEAPTRAAPAGDRTASLLQMVNLRGRGTDLQQAIAQARQGGGLGGQRGMSVVGNKVFTFYAPGASGARGIEGPMIGSRGNALTTLDDVRNGAAMVSLAGHPSQFGQQVFIGNVTYTSPIDGRTYTLNNVIGRVDDTGGKFDDRTNNPDQTRFDIAVGDFSGKDFAGKAWNDKTADKFTGGNVVNAVPGRGIGADIAARAAGTAFGAEPAAIEARAEGGPVKKGKAYKVGEEGPETFVPDEDGTIIPSYAYVPQASREGKETWGKWPRVAVPGYDRRFAHIGLGGAINNLNREAQSPIGSLLDMMATSGLRINPRNWERMLTDPRSQAIGRARIEDRRNDPYF